MIARPPITETNCSKEGIDLPSFFCFYVENIRTPDFAIDESIRTNFLEYVYPSAFIKNLDTDPTQKALVQAMKAVTHTLGKTTIAELWRIRPFGTQCRNGVLIVDRDITWGNQVLLIKF